MSLLVLIFMIISILAAIASGVFLVQTVRADRKARERHHHQR